MRTDLRWPMHNLIIDLESAPAPIAEEGLVTKLGINSTCYMGYGYLRRGDYENAYGAYEEQYHGTINAHVEMRWVQGQHGQNQEEERGKPQCKSRL